MLTLIPKTAKAKQKIKQWGNQWSILRLNGDRMLLVSAKDKTGNRINLPDSARWVYKVDDKDFDIA